MKRLSLTSLFGLMPNSRHMAARPHGNPLQSRYIRRKHHGSGRHRGFCDEDPLRIDCMHTVAGRLKAMALPSFDSPARVLTLALEALKRGPGFDQGAVDREMLVGAQA